MRRREDGAQLDLTTAELIAHLQAKTGDTPWLPLPIPRPLSRRPRFFG